MALDCELLVSKLCLGFGVKRNSGKFQQSNDFLGDSCEIGSWVTENLNLIRIGIGDFQDESIDYI